MHTKTKKRQLILFRGFDTRRKRLKSEQEKKGDRPETIHVFSLSPFSVRVSFDFSNDRICEGSIPEQTALIFYYNLKPIDKLFNSFLACQC